MNGIKTLDDVFTITNSEIESRISGIVTTIPYGSFMTQDLETETAQFPSLHGNGGALEKVPDRIVIVENKKNTLQDIARDMRFGKTRMWMVDHLSRSNPHYFNWQTSPYRIETQEGITRAPIPYKIGIVGLEPFITNKSHYLDMRLSKIAQPFDATNDEISRRLMLSKIRIANNTLLKVPPIFSGEEFAYEYFSITYDMEAYRKLWERGKGASIFKGDVYDRSKRQLVSVRDSFADFFSNYLNSTMNTETTASDVYDHGYERESDIFDNPRWRMRQTLYNIDSGFVSLKNIMSNALGGNSGANYAQEKMRKARFN